VDSFFRVPTAQADDGEVLGGHQASEGNWSKWLIQERWTYKRAGSFSNEGIWTLISRGFLTVLPAWLAIADDDVWSRDVVFSNTNPAIIDSAEKQNRVYVVNDDSGRFLLQRFAWSGNTLEVYSLLFDETPVGSPLLGEPLSGHPTEVYVVTINGKVRAFHAESLELLWEEPLGITVAPGAQPVLVGNTLWVVGAGGEVRGVRVGSNGLNRDAQWPKAFRDNCNTSSKLVTKDNMPSCFE
jgi:hypothetical protein